MPTVLEHGGLVSYSLPGISETMRDKDCRANRNCPTENGISDRPNGRDDTPEANCPRKTLPRRDAEAQTRGCSGRGPRPVGSSARDENNPSGSWGYLAGVLERLEHGQIAREFDAAEDSQPDLDIFEGKPALGGQRYRVEGETDEEWIETGYVIAVRGAV